MASPGKLGVGDAFRDARDVQLAAAGLEGAFLAGLPSWKLVWKARLACWSSASREGRALDRACRSVSCWAGAADRMLVSRASRDSLW